MPNSRRYDSGPRRISCTPARVERGARIALLGAALALLALASVAGYSRPTPSRESRAPIAPTPTPRFQKWTPDNGLPQSSVNSLIQARDGAIWFTTFDGLVRYDGVRFKVFNATNTPALTGNRFVALYEAADGTMWIGGEDGKIYAMRENATRTFDLPIDAASRTVLAIRPLDRGRMAVLTDDAVYEVSVATGTVAPTESELLRSAVTRAISMAHDDSLLGVDGDSLVVLADGVPRRVPFPPDSLRESLEAAPPNARPVAAVREAGDGSVWVISWNGGVLQYAGAGWARVTSLDEVTNGRVVLPRDLMQAGIPFFIPILRDRAGRVWVALARRGVARLDPSGRTAFYATEDGFPPDFAPRTILEDREGSIWVGATVGLYRFKGDLIGTVSSRDGLPADNLLAVLEDSRGAIWVCSRGGELARIENGKIETASIASVSTYVQTSLFEDRDGAVWVAIAAQKNGLSKFVGGQLDDVETVWDTPSDLVRVIVQDRAGDHWLGTETGLYRRGVDGSLTRFGIEQGLAGNAIRAIVEARAGGLWIATWSGLSRYRDGAFTTYREADGLASDRIRSLREDPDGTLWIGSYDRGITRFKDGRFSRITTNEGLPNNGVFAILEDDFGRFWMSCNVGVYCVPRQELVDYSEGRLGRVNAVLFGREDGMLNAECNGGHQPSGVRTRDGRLLFASQGGLVVVDPNAAPPNRTPPPVWIEETVADGIPVGDARAVRIEPRQTEFEIRYTAPSFVKPEMMRFKYRLAGLQQEWSDAGTRRFAFFSYVPPGDYVFEVLAANSDGVWSPEPARLRVVVLAPWWRTFPALTVFALALGGLAFAGVRLRLATLRRQSDELEALVAQRTAELATKAHELEHVVEQLQVSERDALRAKEEAVEANRAKSVFLANMSHELRTPLNAVLGFAQLMERDRNRSAADRDNLAIIQRSGGHLLGLINDVLSIAKIEAGRLTLSVAPFDLRRLIRAVTDMVRMKTDAKELDFVWDISPDLPVTVLGDEGKLRQILINLLSNAVKFTDRGGVALRVRPDGPGRVSFEVTDTGEGISAEEIGKLFEAFVQTESGRQSKEGTGLGLVISRTFVRMMGGDLAVSSVVGKGSTFGFTIDLPETAQQPPTQDARKVIRLAPGQGTYRVLVADDVLENRRLLARLLGSVGFTVREAIDGAEAVALWEEWRPHMVWMDMRMPVVDGLEATRRIRSAELKVLSAEYSDTQHSALSTQHSTKIVGLSASVFEQDRGALFEAGCDDFVPKPFREEMIFEKMATLLGVHFEYEGVPHAAPVPDTPPVVASVTAERLAMLPDDVLEQLRLLVVTGDVVHPEPILERIRETDPALADSVRTMLRRYEFDALLALIESNAAADG